MPDHGYLDDLPAYALGALTAPEKATLDEHLRTGCELCERELLALREAVAILPLALPPRRVPPSVKERLLSTIDEEVRAKARTDADARVVPMTAAGKVPAWTLALPLAAAVVLGIGLASVSRTSREEISRASAENATLKATLKERDTETAWLRDPRVQVALLKGLEATSNAKAKLLWHPSRAQALLYVDGLPALPIDKSYELWFFVENEPVAADVFATNADGTAVISLSKLDPKAGKPVKFAVTVEPTGGVPKPTGTIVLVGENL